MSRPRICLVSPPYNGHLNPLLGLGRELLEMAEVTVISTPIAMAATAAAGLQGRAILREGEKLVLEIASPGKSVKGNPILLFRQLRMNVSVQREMLEQLDSVFSELRPDLVIADFTLPVVGVAASRHGVPWWTTLPSPCVFEAPDGPPAYFGGLSPAGFPTGKAIHWALRKLTRIFKRLMFFVFRHTFRSVGLESIYRKDGSERVYSPDRILAIGVEELEFPRTYPPHFQFIGSMLYTPKVEAPVPEFRSGSRHVLVTMGSHLGHLKDELAGQIRRLADLYPSWMFHFTDGDSSASASVGEGNFRRYPFISYDLHLSGYDLVIHHGGSGILYHCLKHAIPAVVMPVDFDQFDNAARLQGAGVAVWAKSTADLPEAFRQAVEDPSIRAKCREFADIITGYDPGEILRQAVKELLRSKMEIS